MIAPVAAVALAAVLDALAGELPQRVHPVAWLGRLVAPLDRSWSRPRFVGALGALALPLFAAVVVGSAVSLGGVLHSLAGVLLAGLALFATTSLRMLLDAGERVIAASERDPDIARTELPALAGRAAEELSPGEVRSAAVESVAENLADGLLAPLLAFALLAPVSLALGAAGAAWVKAVNTLDSMLGYTDKPVGWAPARLDDVVMWVPARLSAGLLALAALDARVPARAGAWASAPPSPNSGWPMGALAAALDCTLAKPGVYVLNPGADLPSPETARRGVAVVRRAGVLAWVGSAALAGGLAAAGVVGWS